MAKTGNYKTKNYKHFEKRTVFSFGNLGEFSFLFLGKNLNLKRKLEVVRSNDTKNI